MFVEMIVPKIIFEFEIILNQHFSIQQAYFLILKFVI